MVADMLPFIHVESPYLKDLLSLIPGVRDLPSDATIRANILTTFEEAKENVKTALQVSVFRFGVVNYKLLPILV
jgi:hypothetical protein